MGEQYSRYHLSWVNLMFIRQAIWMYNEEFDVYPYTQNDNSDDSLRLLVKFENKKTSPQLLLYQLYHPTEPMDNEIFYETFNLAPNEYDIIDTIWKECYSNADFSVKEIPSQAPRLWEKQVIRDSKNVLYIENDYMGIQWCDDGENFLKLVQKVKEKLKRYRDKTDNEASSLKLLSAPASAKATADRPQKSRK
jgi:hypothetical protein